MTELEELLCESGKVREFNAAFEKLAPACLPEVGEKRLKRAYLAKLPHLIRQQLIPTRDTAGLQKLKADALALEASASKARQTVATKKPNPDRLQCNRCKNFYWRERGCWSCKNGKSTTTS